ncbi:MAG: hypothetical protein ABS75_03295 [Pelagibacterium sp. SCN 63-23]|nr:MAG: hypothetical protein ABS75_03295 [Pelagibacterium sp. SCN 63-23]
MAGQTEAPDDLIAELARLMADDARTDQAVKDAPPPVRIPGGQAPAAASPVPRFDFSATSAPVERREPAAPAAPAIRIPGSEPAPVAPAAAAQVPDKPDEAEPFAFDFDLAAGAPAGPVTRVGAPAPEAPISPRPVEPEPEAVPLDGDSLADLIAAELASDMGLEPAQPDLPEVPGPARGEDNFGVPPVFGLGAPAAPEKPVPVSEPEPVAMYAEAAEPEPVEPESVAPRPDDRDTVAGDPLDEIERLVAPAVRMNMAAPTPSPALRSLATPTVPVAPIEAQPAAPDLRADSGSVDEAILAAAAATGARVEWVHEADDGTAYPEEEDVAPRARRTPFRGLPRAVAGPLVAVGLLAVAGFGLYWVLGQGGAPSGPAPLLVAETAPVKEVPEVDTSASPQQSVVFNEMSGGNNGANEQIVSRDQADADTVAEVNSAAGGTGVIASGDSASVDPNQDGLVNRKVRTVTVRPDGTIVSGDNSLAGNAILPVDRPNVPEVPGADFSTPELVASAETTTPAAGAPAPVAEATITPATPGAVIPVVDATGAAIQGRSVTMPMERPADFAQAASAALAAASVAPTAPAPAATTPAAVAPVPAGGGAAAYVQLASQRSEDAARQSAQAIATRYGVLFGGANLEIQRVDLGERGIYYRVLVPAASREGAANICANVKAAGGDCLLL